MNSQLTKYTFLFFLTILSALVSAQSPNKNLEFNNLLNKLNNITAEGVSFTYQGQSAHVKFVSLKKGNSIKQPFNGLTSSNPKEVAVNFLTEYKSLFGEQYKADYTLIKDTVNNGKHSVKLQQRFKGVPVFAGQMVVRLNQSLDVTGSNGIIASKLNLGVSTKPLVSREGAKEQAIIVVKKYNMQNGLEGLSLGASEPVLWIYNPRLLGKKSDVNSLAWRINVTDSSHLRSNHDVFINAITGRPLNRISNIYDAKNRSIHDLENDITITDPPPGPVARIEGQAATGIADVDNAYDFFGDTYDFYLTTHNRDSVDDAGMTLVATVRFCIPELPCPFENAAWINELQQMIFGQGFAVDDITGHEVTHGVTSLTSNLIYQDESGAINESFSDLWGEFIDLSNDAGNDDPSVKWQMGEDLGATRSMKDPTLFGHPDKITSSNYYCGSDDSGGVHTNSGVNNKAAYLMADGDTFNEITVNGIGIIKTAKIYYEAQTNILTSGSTYSDLYTALNSACSSLIGTAGITVANCVEVNKALDAVEMNSPPCPLPPVPLCSAGSMPSYLVNEDFEAGIGSWTHSANIGPDVWSLSTYFPSSGSLNLHGNGATEISDSSIRSNLGINIPSNAYMYFSHSGNLEEGFDGGVVEYTTNNGITWNETNYMYTHNGYAARLNGGSPLGVMYAFTGDYKGRYQSSRISLSTLSGSTVDFRFRTGTDSTVGTSGWDIDDVKIYTCNIPSPALISPVQEAILSGDSETFEWANNTINVSNWWLEVGSSIGTHDYYNSGNLPSSATSKVVTGLPLDGNTVYARLWFNISNTWEYKDYTYRAAWPTLILPTPSSKLNGATETFSWTDNNTSVTRWQLYIGSTKGAKDYYKSDSLPASVSSVVASGLPTDASIVHVRLWFNINNSWSSEDYSYIASAVLAPSVSKPVSGLTLSGPIQTFSWLNNGSNVSRWQLYVGSTAGSKDYYNSGLLASNTMSSIADGLPTDASVIYARLWYEIDGTWASVDSTYTAFATAAPKLTFPMPNSVLNATNLYFNWHKNEINVTAWLLTVGSSLGANNFHNSGNLDTYISSQYVSGLPSDGSTVYASLWYKENGSWNKNNYTFTAATIEPEVSYPAPGSILSSSSNLFSFTSNGLDITAWQLYVGSDIGGKDYYDSGALSSNTSQYVTGLPGDGSMIYARLWYKVNGSNAWKKTDHTYTAAIIKPKITSPYSGSTLSSGSPYFYFTSNDLNVTEWQLYVGSAVGGKDYYDSGSLDSSIWVQHISGLPGDGSTIYARLRYKLDNSTIWEKEDYTYTAATISPELTSPSYSTLYSGSEHFRFSSHGLNVATWQLYVGSSIGGKEYYDSGALDSSTTYKYVTGLPGDGSMVYARLWYKMGGSTTWKREDYTYTAATVSPELASPSPNSTFYSGAEYFNFSIHGLDVTEWQFYVGSSFGGKEYYDSGVLDLNTTYKYVTGLPGDGSTVYASLWYKMGNNTTWERKNYTYTAATIEPAITSPSSGSTIYSNYYFYFSSYGLNVTEWQLYVGSAVGGKDYYDSGTLDINTTHQYVTGLPSDGSTVYARLWYKLGGSTTWKRSDYTYTSSN